MEYLHNAVRDAIAALVKLRTEIDSADSKVRKTARLTLDLQLAGLRMLEREVRSGSPSRRVWSLGQASVPVLPTVIRSIERQSDQIHPDTVAQCRRSVISLDEALTRFAEDR